MQTIEIHKEIQLNIDDLMQGLSKMDLLTLEKFSAELNKVIARRKTPNLPDRELELLDAIYAPFSSAKQQRYDELYRKLQDEQITPSEHEELLQLVEQSEQHNAEWLEHLAELAILRGIPMLQLKNQLDK